MSGEALAYAFIGLIIVVAMLIPPDKKRIKRMEDEIYAQIFEVDNH